MSVLTKGGRSVTAGDDYDLLEGTEVGGTPEVVLLRWQVKVEGDELAGKPGDGKFVKRARFGEGRVSE